MKNNEQLSELWVKMRDCPENLKHLIRVQRGI